MVIFFNRYYVETKLSSKVILILNIMWIKFLIIFMSYYYCKFVCCWLNIFLIVIIYNNVSLVVFFSVCLIIFSVTCNINAYKMDAHINNNFSVPIIYRLFVNIRFGFVAGITYWIKHRFKHDKNFFTIWIRSY